MFNTLAHINKMKIVGLLILTFFWLFGIGQVDTRLIGNWDLIEIQIDSINHQIDSIELTVQFSNDLIIYGYKQESEIIDCGATIEKIKWIRWKEKELKEQCDGEIQFEYGERFFNVKKIILKM